jgi:hypothetical protein
MPSKEPLIGFKNLALDQVKLSCQRHEAVASGRRNTIILALSDEIQQNLDPVTPQTSDNAERGKMRADRVGQRSTLADY